MNNYIKNIVGCNTICDDNIIFYSLYNENNEKNIIVVENTLGNVYTSYYNYGNMPIFIKNIYLYCIVNGSLYDDKINKLYGPCIDLEENYNDIIKVDFPKLNDNMNLFQTICKERYDWYNEVNDMINKKSI